MKRILLDRNEGIKSDQHIKKKKKYAKHFGQIHFFFSPLGQDINRGCELSHF